MVIFISIAYVVVKLKIFKVFCFDSVSMKWSLFGCFWALNPANGLRSCSNFDQSLSLIRQTILSSILSGCQVSASGYLLFATLLRRTNYFFLVQDSVRPILRGLGAITSVSKVRWKRNFDYR